MTIISTDRIKSVITADLIFCCSQDGWAILARNGALLDSVESALSKMQIPYHRVGGKSFWDHKAAATFLGFIVSRSSKHLWPSKMPFGVVNSTDTFDVV
jgi:hypothetical protein